MTEPRHQSCSLRIDRRLAIALLVAVTSVNAAQAAPDSSRPGWFTPGCANADLRALAAIEERGAIADTPAERLAAAGLQFLQARILCLSGQEAEGVALYQSVIALDAPVRNAGKAIEGARP